jgi:hypothetical protein
MKKLTKKQRQEADRFCKNVERHEKLGLLAPEHLAALKRIAKSVKWLLETAQTELTGPRKHRA